MVFPSQGFLAMAEVAGTSVDVSSPLSPASPPPFDPIDEVAPRPKSPWSQVVRGSPNSSRSTPGASSCSLQPDDEKENHHHLHLASELRVTEAAHVHVSNLSSSPDHIDQGALDTLEGASANSTDTKIKDICSVESTITNQSHGKSPKKAWNKAVPNPVSPGDPEPVMGAIAWPALSEARVSKSSETWKAGAGQKAGLRSPLSVNEGHSLQTHQTVDKEVGVAGQRMTIQNSSNKVDVGGNPLTTAFKDTGSLGKDAHSADSEQSKWKGGRDSRVPTSSQGSLMHPRGTISSHPSMKDNTRNFMWDQGRGNHSFPAYGRVHQNMREHMIPAHHQRDVPSNMYYMPGSTTEPVIGSAYYVPAGVQGMYIPSADHLTAQGMVIKQIEYYFSVENLCRDIYLRSKMDEWGFVPVSVIANFNRVKMITQNPYFIVEALRLSNVVEVQGDKVRKKGDWANWLLPASQRLTASIGDKDQAVGFSTTYTNEDMNHNLGLRSSGMEKQNEIEKQVNEELEKSMDNQSKHFAQSCSIERGVQS
ncbi:hypothetical protein KP509_25G050300 [Ceratopteris richardii]|uniref:HTH La-type RNA-binding domain-containing protein n=1 Tax=Ceratopteris richardii TaxID=49495 RepID=A0A8T2RT13_CERRI|nr:hypothetical protein KP509_25G050300 [Ceratopteris richardii]